MNASSKSSLTLTCLQRTSQLFRATVTADIYLTKDLLNQSSNFDFGGTRWNIPSHN